jgi:hypothetical protein
MTDEEFQRWKTEIEGAVGHLGFSVFTPKHSSTIYIRHPQATEWGDRAVAFMHHDVHREWCDIQCGRAFDDDWLECLQVAISGRIEAGTGDTFVWSCIIKNLQSITLPSHGKA